MVKETIEENGILYIVETYDDGSIVKYLASASTDTPTNNNSSQQALDSQTAILEGLASLYEQQAATEENQLAIMEALADIYANLEGGEQA